jgi:hypothetical protein
MNKMDNYYKLFNKDQTGDFVLDFIELDENIVKHAKFMDMVKGRRECDGLKPGKYVRLRDTNKHQIMVKIGK